MHFLALLLLLQTPQLLPVPQATATARVATGGISGHVYAMDTGMPLKRAQVSLRADRRGEDRMAATADAQGAFEFRNLEPGTYTLYCNKSGYIATSYGQRGPNQAGSRLTLAEGQTLKDIDFRLIRGGVISGTVLDEDGEPLARVGVQALARQYIRGRAQATPRGSATTDDRGQYRIFNLSPGRYYLQASFGGFGGEQDTAYAPIFYPNALGIKEAQRIDVINGGEVSRIDFTLRLVRTYSVSGKVLDQRTGQPVGGGYVSATGADLESIRFGGGNQIRPDGSFRLRGLTPGHYRLMVMTGGGNRGDMRSGMESPSRPATRPFDLGAADLENLIVTVGPGVTVRGRLLADGGTISPEGLRVWLTGKGDSSPAFSMAGSGKIENDLSFTITGVQAGEYYLNVGSGPFAGSAPPSSAPFYVREARVGGQNVADRGLVVPEGAEGVVVEVVLDFNGGTVAGRALNDSGEPFAGAQVALIGADPQRRESDRYFRTAATDQGGQFAIRGLIPGDYLMVLWPQSDAGQLQDPELFAQIERYAVAVRVEKSATTTQEIKLPSELKTIAQNLSQ